MSAHMRFTAALLSAAAIFGSDSVVSPAVANAASACRNYEVGTKWGKVTVDARPRNGDPIGNITWWWIINQVNHRAGLYTYSIFINDRQLGPTQAVTKDDNLHFTIARIQNHKPVYGPGDIISVRAHHPIPSENTTYVTPLNSCVVPVS